MDALSDVLSMLRVSSALSSRFEGSGAWAFRFPAFEHIKFGAVVTGRLHLWLEDSNDVLALEQGDFYLLTTGQPFCSASDPTRPAVDGPAAYHAVRSSDGVVRVRGDAEGMFPHVSLASGRFAFEDDAGDVLLRHLPPLIHLKEGEAGTAALTHLLALLGEETGALQPGTDIARAGLAALVLVNALRVYLRRTPAPMGWLGALSDTRVGHSLSLMHSQPGHRWTLQELAASVNMSRTAFATHFRKLVGCAPMDYLNRWRMAVARAALRHSDESLAVIADRIGYLSDTAFSIAFKRLTGESPGRFRSRALAESSMPR
jgi:AraC-like DNA-binding protein